MKQLWERMNGWMATNSEAALAGFSLFMAALVMVVMVVSCAESQEKKQAIVAPQPVAQVAPAAAPVVVQNQNDGMLTGLLLGHMMSSSGNSAAPAQSQAVVNKTVINRTIINPSPRPVTTYKPATAAKPATTYRTTTRSYSTVRSYSRGR